MPEPQDGPLRADNDPALDDAQTLPPSVPPVVEDEPAPGPRRVGCRTHLRGWAGGHLHGSVRPRRHAVGRGRPPRRWC